MKKKRKYALKSVKRAQYRQYTFNRLLKGIGKGNKKSLKQIRKENDKGDITEEFYDRDSIENAIAQYNKLHFRQAFSSKAYRDKIYKKLKYDEIRERILCGELEVKECDDNNVYSFLTLLKR